MDGSNEITSFDHIFIFMGEIWRMDNEFWPSLKSENLLTMQLCFSLTAPARSNFQPLQLVYSELRVVSLWNDSGLARN